MFWFYATARKVEVKKSDTLVSDSINVYPCKFSFSADWEGLTKTAVFRAGTQAIEVLLDENCQCEIPWEVLLKHKLELYVGCYGTKGEDIILNTTWTNLGKIAEGTKNKAVLGEDPTPDIYTQLASQIGDLSALDTEDKSSLVNAINEVNTKAGEFESDLETKVDKTGGTITGPVMFTEDGPVMAYTFEDEPVEDDKHGLVVSSTGILKDSEGPLNISTVSQEIVFGHNSKIRGVVGDEEDITSVPNVGQMNAKVSEIKEEIPTKTSQLQNDSKFITLDDIPNIPSDTEVPTKVSQLQNDVGYITENDIPPIPTKTSELVNDSNFATEQYVQNAVSGIESGDGSTGKDGENGVTFIPSVSDDGIISWTNDGGLENPEPVDIMGPEGNPGPKGEDGISPTVETSINDDKDGINVTITDVNGAHSFTILNGLDGENGEGVPTGGTKDQILAKSSDEDYDTHWIDLPKGGVGDTTAYLVKAPIGTIVIWSGTIDNIPDGWQLCDGTNGTPDLRDKFVLGAGDSHAIGETGGSEEVTLTESQMPAHTHATKLKAQNNTSNTTCLTASAWTSDTYTNYGGTSSVIQEVGGSKPHNNMPPYYVLCYIIKVTEDETDTGTTYTAGKGISIENDTISVELPTIYLTKEEYDNLTEEQKNENVIYAIPENNYGSYTGGANIYSNEETKIGTWIDGRTVFRKVFSIKTPETAGMSVDWIDVSDLNIDSLIKTYGSVAGRSIPFLGSYNLEEFTCWLSTDHLNIACYTNDNAQLLNANADVIIEYVKSIN